MLTKSLAGAQTVTAIYLHLTELHGKEDWTGAKVRAQSWAAQAASLFPNSEGAGTPGISSSAVDSVAGDPVGATFHRANKGSKEP